MRGYKLLHIFVLCAKSTACMRVVYQSCYESVPLFGDSNTCENMYIIVDVLMFLAHTFMTASYFSSQAWEKRTIFYFTLRMCKCFRVCKLWCHFFHLLAWCIIFVAILLSGKLKKKNSSVYFVPFMLWQGSLRTTVI